MKSFLDVAMAAARLAGEVLLRRTSQIRIHFKGEGKHNVVSNIDLEAEEVITGLIKEHYPGHQILAEEGGLQQRDSSYKWIIDPLDGTTNYIHGFPFFGVSIALEFEGTVIIGVVHDPVRNDLFYSEKGKGAFLNGVPLHVSELSELGKALLVTGFSYDFRENPDNNFDYFYHFSRSSQAVRRTGSAALDLCYIAAGYFDGFWELKLSPWDVAAGSLLVLEAGGKLTGFKDEPYSIYSENILATNGHIHASMIQLFKTKKKPIPWLHSS
ncbi:MAG: inositol monophosphatase family protein [Nitrospiria bacterium]